MGLDIETLRESYAAVVGQSAELVDRFFSDLFSKAPAIKPLFGETDMQSQKRKLRDSIALVIRTIDKPEKLEPALKELGRKHVDYGAQPKHYPVVAETLVGALAKTAGDSWTPKMEKAWSETLEAVAALMLEGAKEPA